MRYTTLLLLGVSLFLVSCQPTVTLSSRPEMGPDNDDLYEELIRKIDSPVEYKVCHELPSLAEGVCETTAGSNGYTLLRGNVLKTFEDLQGGEVLIDPDGTITCADCDCSNEEGYALATTISCPDGVISPGLINPHDHLGYNHNTPSSWGAYRFDRRNLWRKDPEHRVRYTENSNYEAVIWTELRQIIAGTTSIASDNPAKGFLRNFEKSAKYEEGFGPERVNYDVFPLGDTSDVTPHYEECGYPDIIDPDSLDHFACFLPHVSEGVDQYAWNEFYCLSGRGPAPGVNITSPKSSLIHMVPLYPDDARILQKQLMSVVWSPRSNVSLYGNTAPIPLYKTLKPINIALSSDWTPSGSIDLLRELKCADSLNGDYFNTPLDDRDLWLAVTTRAALALRSISGRFPSIGWLVPYATADIAIYDGSSSPNHYRAVIDADPTTVALVLRGGVPQYGDYQILQALGEIGAGKCESYTICSAQKSVCAERETGYSMADLQGYNQDLYPLFFCDSLGAYTAPPDEPSCLPERVQNPIDNQNCGVYPVAGITDRDHDGISDSQDNCPTVFNPVRPVDYVKYSGCLQSDQDHDGIGDACDPTP